MAYNTLHDRLRGPIRKALTQELKQKNIFALPRIDRVIVNVGINRSRLDSKEMHEYIADCLMKITGQKPVFTRARKAISNFKVRENMIVGAVVTLRGKHMEEFLDRLLSYALPRVRDFRGLPHKLDGHGNYSIGLRDHSVFPEVPPVDAKQLFGMQILIVTTAKTDAEAKALLKEVGVPFKRDGKEVSSSAKSAEGKKGAHDEKKKEEQASNSSSEESSTSTDS